MTIALWLSAIVMVSLNLRLSETPQIASSMALLLSALTATSETLNFLNRTMAWEAVAFVPGYYRKIWLTSLGIVGFYMAFAVALSFVFGDFSPLIGITTLFTLVNLTITIYARQTSSSAASVYSILVFFTLLVIFWALFSASSQFQFDLFHLVTSPIVQIPALVFAAIAALYLKKQIESTVRSRNAGIVITTARFRIDVAGRYRICGWALPSTRLSPGFIYVIPLFVIAGMSHVSFADEDSLLLQNPVSIFSMIAAIYIYIGSGTPFGLLKNPGMWFSKTWQFGLGRSRRALGTEFARNIVKASIVPAIAVFGVAFIHATYIEAPSANWPGYANFYDEAILLITMNLLCFTWACMSYPRRTTECPVFVHIRIAMCVATCLVFWPGVDFSLITRVFLLVALASSAILAVYVGGRGIAEIDFISIKTEKDAYSG